MIYASDSERTLGLVYGAIAQGLSDDAAIKHASWWMDVDRDELKALVKTLHPDGLENERQLQKRLLSFEMIVRSQVNNIVDKYIRNNGLNDKSVSVLWQGISSFFESVDAGHAMACMSDRLLFWRKRTLFYRFKAGNATPMILKRRHYGSAEA